jgi:DMSO reductase anchor subunit
LNPALSVIFFTTLSGAGYGLLVWTAIAALCGEPARVILFALMLALVLVTTGLLSSLAHLGQPQRAWRALSQWRTSWLSREGVAALLTYVPALCLGAAALPGMLGANGNGSPLALNPVGRLVCTALIVSALATIACTAMIYASLKPIPAWRHRLVLPVYLLCALLTGGLLAMALLQQVGTGIGSLASGSAAVTALVLLVCKWRYWRDTDATPLPQTRGDAVGLPARSVSVFERPHTEANYLTREMAFVLARKHAVRLRWLASALLALLPIVCVLLVLFAGGGPSWFVIAAIAAIAGTFVERWLFFAQARHLVTLYY